MPRHLWRKIISVVITQLTDIQKKPDEFEKCVFFLLNVLVTCCCLIFQFFFLVYPIFLFWFLILTIQSLHLGLEIVLLRISYSSACGHSLNSLWTAFISYLYLPTPWLPSLSKENCLCIESLHSQMWVTAHSYPILTCLSLVSLPTYRFLTSSRLLPPGHPWTFSAGSAWCYLLS